MIHSALILDALDALADSRVYAVTFPQEPLPEWPAIRFTPYGGPISSDACNGGSEDTDDIPVQFDFAAKTYEEAAELCRRGREALQAIEHPGLNVSAISSPRYEPDPDFKVILAIQDFLFSGSSVD